MDVYRCIAPGDDVGEQEVEWFQHQVMKDFQTSFFWCAVRVGITTRRGWLIVGGDETNRFLREVCTSIHNLDYHQVFACCSNWISLVSIYHSTIFAGPLSFGFPHPFGVPAEVRTGTIERWRKFAKNYYRGMRKSSSVISRSKWIGLHPEHPNTCWIYSPEQMDRPRGVLSFLGVCTWRIIPVSKWLITMVSKSPK